MSNPAAQVSPGKATLQHSLRLGAFALGTAALLVFADNLTKAQIDLHRLEFEQQLLIQVLPASLHDNDLTANSFRLGPDSRAYRQPELLGLSTTRTGYLATMKGMPAGVILPFETEGYGGAIVLVIGIATDGSITGVRVLQHGETPGLGGQIDISESQWITGFNQHSLTDTPESKWQVKGEGGNCDQFVGAPITPRAVVAAVHNALLFFEANKNVLLAAGSKKEP